MGGGPTWLRGSIVEASWALYANHGGGYSYRLCKRDPTKPVDGITEDCFQGTPLDFVGNLTTIRYPNGEKPPFTIPAVSTNVGTHPAGSMWRKNPVPMCNCDLGYLCGVKDAGVAAAGTRGAGAYKPTADVGPVDAKTMFTPYNKTNFHPGQTSSVCPTGVQYPSMWDDGLGGPPYEPGTGMQQSTYRYEMIDELKVPTNIPAGEYVLSWRWDCEETPQVWNSCADLKIA